MLLAAASLASPAFGQDDNTDGLYLGAGLGDFSTDIDEPSDVDDVDLDFDTDDSARKAFVGWRFNRFFAAQLDVVDFGRSQAAANQLRVSAESEGVAPSIVGTLPLGPVELFLRGGILWYDLSIERNTEVFEDSDRDPVFSTGIGFTVAERVNLRLEYEVVDIDTFDDAHAVWLNAAWRF
jgi:hypothetical protein